VSRGFALPLALVVLATIGGLSAALLFVAMVSRRSGDAMLELVRAQYVSESDASRVANGLTATDATALPLSDVPAPMLGGEVTRFGSSYWMVSADAGQSAYEVRRRIGLVVTARPPELVLKQALTTPGTVEISGSTVIDLWGATSDERCAASPVDTVASGFATGQYEQLEEWLPKATVTLAGGTTITPQPSVAGSICGTEDPSNWGDPADAGGVCQAHYPAVSVDGDLVVEGGIGQGALLVKGDLTLRSGFRFRGLVMVGGRLAVELGGASVEGTVQVNDTASRGSTLEDARIWYSGCALRSALAQFGGVSLIGRRAWFQLY